MEALLGLGAFAAIAGILTLLSIWRGYVMTVLWGWFVVPTFGLPALPVAVAIGLSFLIGMFGANNKKDDKDTGDQIASALVLPLFALGFGWVAHQFV